MKRLLLFPVFFVTAFTCLAQQNVGIGTASPNASALLELSSTSKGILIPRMLASQIGGIPSPATGLLVFQTDAAPGFYYNQGTPASPVWVILGGGSPGGWSITGNTGTNPATNYMGTTDNQPMLFRQNNFWTGKWDANLGNYFIGDSSGAKTSPTTSANGRYNTAIGDSALLNNTTGSFNIAFGLRALKLNGTGDGNFAGGHRALYTNDNGADNVAIGREAMFSNVGGSNNVALGEEAMRQNTSGLRNTAIGFRAVYNNLSGVDNIGIGYNSLFQTKASNNIGLGNEVLYMNDDGFNNIAAGYNALYGNTSGSDNIAFGFKALDSNKTGISNIALGNEALFNTTTGSNNLSMGAESMHANRTGYGNVALGYWSLRSNNTGHSNVAIGTAAMHFNTSGQYNVAIGYEALRTNNAGSDNVAIGHHANYGVGTSSNATAIGAYASAAKSNALVLGSIKGVNNAGADVYVGIGTSTPDHKLHVVTDSSSDGGWGEGIMIENINTVTGEAALSFRNKAMPFTRQWNIGLNQSSPLAFNYGTSFTGANTRMLIDTFGNVAIGKTTPAAKLDVNGTLAIAGTAAIGGSTTVTGNITIPSANDYGYSTPKSKTLNIPFAAFRLTPADGTSTTGITTTSINNGLWVEGGTSGVSANFDAPVYLPSGATVTGITLWVRDNTGVYEVEADLAEISGAAHTVVASVPGTGVAATPGDTFITVSSLSVVISSIKSYYLRFRTKENNGNLRIYNARINYTVDNAD